MFFNRDSKPVIPLAIELPDDLPDRTYVAGSVINGRVRLVGAANLNGQSILIRFIGRSDTSMLYHHDDFNDVLEPSCGHAQLFTYEKTLFQSPSELPLGRSWTFSFSFPPKGDNVGSDKVFASPS